MMRWALWRVTIGAMVLHAAAEAARPAFDVATVKFWTPPKGDSFAINLGQAVHGKVTLTNATLSDCLKFAYGFSSDAQLAGPAWMNSGEVRLDVVGQAPRDTPRERLLEMLQSLLAERLKIVTHRESKQMSYIALVVAKGGAKMEPAKPDAPPPGIALAGKLNSPQMPMVTLAKLLSRMQKDTVLDMTGLKGLFEVHLQWAYEPPGQPRDPTEPPAGPSLQDALQQQLGLRLESRKGPVEVLVVDSASKTPLEN